MRPGVLIETALGTMRAELHDERAPNSCGYFLAHVRSGAFKSCSFFRIVTAVHARVDGRPAIEVVQGGHPPDSAHIEPTIIHETTRMTGLEHRRGTLSLARFRPGAVYASFFICLRDESALDFAGLRHPDGLGFAAFGRLASGWEVLDRLRSCAEPRERLCVPIGACICIEGL